LKVHLARLVDLELVTVHKPDSATGYLYGLAWDGQGVDGSRFVIGLADPATLTDQSINGYQQQRSGNGRDPVGPRSGGGRNRPEGSSVQLNSHKSSSPIEDSETHCSEDARRRVVVVAASA
jgi:hypothetical protein